MRYFNWKVRISADSVCYVKALTRAHAEWLVKERVRIPDGEIVFARRCSWWEYLICA